MYMYVYTYSHFMNSLLINILQNLIFQSLQKGCPTSKMDSKQEKHTWGLRTARDFTPNATKKSPGK